MVDEIKLSGNFPVMPTPFKPDGSVSDADIKKIIEYLCWGNVDGLTILANASEGFALSDYEKDRITELIITGVDNRVPVVVTVNHYSSQIAAQMARRAQDLGAAAVMAMPPFFGANRAEHGGIKKFYDTISNRVNIPIIVQDDPVLSGINLSVLFIKELVSEVPGIKYLKLECPQSPRKVEAVLDKTSGQINVFGGAGGIVYLDELDRGACGTMASAALLELGNIYYYWQERDLKKAEELFYHILPLIVFEIYQAPKFFTKEMLGMAEVIDSSSTRYPLAESFDRRSKIRLQELVSSIRPVLMLYKEKCGGVQ